MRPRPVTAVTSETPPPAVTSAAGKGTGGGRVKKQPPPQPPSSTRGGVSPTCSTQRSRVPLPGAARRRAPGQTATDRQTAAGFRVACRPGGPPQSSARSARRCSSSAHCHCTVRSVNQTAQRIGDERLEISTYTSLSSQPSLPTHKNIS